MGQKVDNPQQAAQLEGQGWVKCRNPQCDYWLTPEEFAEGEDRGHYFSCPNCKLTYSLVDPTPFIVGGGGVRGNPYGDEGYGAEGIANRDYETVVGITMKQQGDIAEELVQGLGEIPNYGPITWWSETYNDPIDGAAGEWGIEVKAICIDAKNHRFIPGAQPRKEQMIARAQELGFKGIVGMLVVLDYRRSVADIYTMEMPLAEWTTGGGLKVQGPVAFRSHNGTHLVKEVAFSNPFLNPQSDEPEPYHISEGLPW